MGESTEYRTKRIGSKKEEFPSWDLGGKKCCRFRETQAAKVQVCRDHSRRAQLCWQRRGQGRHRGWECRNKSATELAACHTSTWLWFHETSHMCGVAGAPETHCLGLATVSRERTLVLTIRRPLEGSRDGQRRHEDWKGLFNQSGRQEIRLDLSASILASRTMGDGALGDTQVAVLGEIHCH